MIRRLLLGVLALLAAPAVAAGAVGDLVTVTGTGTSYDGKAGEVVYELKSGLQVVALNRYTTATGLRLYPAKNLAPQTVPTPPPAPAPIPAAGCTTTVSTVPAAQDALTSAAAGTSVCLADGSYGPLSLSTNRATRVTLRAEHPGQASVGKVTVLGANYTLTGLKIAGVEMRPGAHDITIDHNRIEGGSFGVIAAGGQFPVPGGCCAGSSLPPIQHIEITGNILGRVTGEDAVRLDGFKDVLVEGNEFTGIASNNGSHADGVQTVWGGSDLTIRRNYIHDNNIQPIFIGKDGDVTNLTVDQNLIVRDRVGASPTQVVSWVLEPHHAVIRNNTFVGENDLILARSSGDHGGGNPAPAAPVDAQIDHNVFAAFKPVDYDQAQRAGVFAGNPGVLVENYNVMARGRSFTWAPGSLGGCSVASDAPAFAAPVFDDYRLTVTNACGTFAAGVTWAPAGQHYGP